MSAPLAGRGVAVTRPEPGALGARLAALGAAVVHVPLIEIGEAPDGGRACRAALARLAAYDWVVVTSANGARRVGAAVGAHQDVRLAAVGAATAAVLEELAGRPVDLVPSVPRVEGIVAEFPRRPARVLVAQADRAGTALADGLGAAGHVVESVVAYATVARRPSAGELAALAGVDAVVFASGSAAASWAECVGGDRLPVAVAVGPVTAAAMRQAGLAVSGVAPAPDAETVAEAVVAALADEPPSAALGAAR